MKTLTTLTVMGIAGILLASCAGTRSVNQVPTMKEAASQDEEWQSGIYNKKNGQNVWVEVSDLREKLSIAEKKAFDAERRADAYRRDLEQVQYENQLLRVRANIKNEKEVVQIKSFDNQNNPVYEKTKTVESTDVLPARNPASSP